MTTDSKNILIADDSLFFRAKISEALAEAGHKVTETVDGSEAVKKIEENPENIDLLILDLQMPNLDGFGTLEWMKNNGHSGRFPVLVISGIEEPGEVVERLRVLGASGLMTKNSTHEQIIHRINRILFPESAD
jgi:putative two-component system response regulator